MPRGNKKGCKSHGRHGRDPESVRRYRLKQKEKYRNDPEYRAKILDQQAKKYAEDAEYAAKVRDRVNCTRYGISPEEYNERRKRSCEICGTYKPPTRRGGIGMNIDHDHDTGKVRGTLCDDCNRGLGCLKDNIERLGLAIEYLKKYNTSEEDECLKTV